MRLPEYAKKLGVTYRTAWRYWQEGKIPNAYQLPSGTVIVEEEGEVDEVQKPDLGVVIYARVSSPENKNNLEAQADRLKHYCITRGYKIQRIVKEVGSGVNDNRRKLQGLLADGKARHIVVEHKDRLTRFGYCYLETMFHHAGRKIEVVNHAEDDTADLMQDFISSITYFCTRIYGQRRSRRKTEKLIEQLNQ